MVNSAHFSGSRSAELRIYMEGGNCYWSTAHISVAADWLNYGGNSTVHISVAADWLNYGGNSTVHISVAADRLNYVHAWKEVTVISQQCTFQWQQIG